jgi:FAD:protein FMN transferase
MTGLVFSVSRRFRVMGSDAHVIVVGDAGDPSLLDHAESRLRDLEARWSRFVPTSEISRLNAAGGRPTLVSAETAALIRTAVDGHRRTGGAFDPTVLGDVLRAGYTASFERLMPRRMQPSDLTLGCEGIVITDQTVTMPVGVGFDPGGIGKGLAADLVVADLLAHGAAGTCVNVGGDLRVEGISPRGGTWTIDIASPDPAAVPIGKVGVRCGALATSTVARRTWTVEGEHRHHLIDPRTGQPSRSAVRQASVVAGTAAEAEVLAKAALVNGEIDDDVPALLVSCDGEVTSTPALHPFLPQEVSS